MASKRALGEALQALLDNGHRIPDGTTAQRIGKHWESYLEPFSDEEVQIAIHKMILIRTVSSWPPIAAIVANVPRVEAAKKIEAVDDADEVFGEVLDLIRDRGSYREPGPLELDPDEQRSKAIYRGIQSAGGWRSLCLCSYEQIAAPRAAFRAAYRSHMAKSKALGDWDNTKALPAPSNGEPRSIAGILEHMDF